MNTKRNDGMEKKGKMPEKEKKSNVKSANAILDDLEAMKSILRPENSRPQVTNSGDNQERKPRTKEQILADLDELIADTN